MDDSFVGYPDDRHVVRRTKRSKKNAPAGPSPKSTFTKGKMPRIGMREPKVRKGKTFKEKITKAKQPRPIKKGKWTPNGTQTVNYKHSKHIVWADAHGRAKQIHYEYERN